MSKITRHDTQNLIAQGVLNTLCTYSIYAAYQVDITPVPYPLYLLTVHIILFLFQFYRKVHITLIYSVILLWTFACIVFWPEGIVQESGFQGYTLAIGSVGMALSAWLMYVFNNRRW
jgi:hypothetical protein